MTVSRPSDPSPVATSTATGAFLGIFKMPEFKCEHCGNDLRQNVQQELREARYYTPYEVSVVCPACGEVTIFALEWGLVVKGASYVGAAHQ